MINLTIKQIKDITQGILVKKGACFYIKGISINSKTTQKGNLFIAIKGNRYDGHCFIKEAARKGASCIMVSRHLKTYPKGVSVIFVPDGIKALGQIAGNYRNQFSLCVIAITGSAGKTTTKDLIARVLDTKYKVLKTEGTQNNHIGLPLTLLKCKPSTDVIVVELGSNQPGDIQWLSRIASPDIAVITNIGESHLELLKTKAKVFKEKVSIIQTLPQGKTVILNGDDPYLRKILRFQKKYKIITFGIDQKTDYRATDIQIINNHKLTCKINGSRTIVLKTPVMANIYNAFAAISCGRALNVGYNDIGKSISNFYFSGNRQFVKKISGCWIINDTYNANPVSARSALNTLSSLKNKGRKIFVFADMLELGKSSSALHGKIGRWAKNLPIDLILTYGKMSQYVGRVINHKEAQKRAYHYSSLPLLHKKLLSFLHPGDAVLVKGSRGMHMERTIQFLTKRLK